MVKQVIEGDEYKDGGWKLYKMDKHNGSYNKDKKSEMEPLVKSLAKMYPADQLELFVEDMNT